MRLQPGDVVLRRRAGADVDTLVSVLTSQQPDTRYPFRWPLPMPVRDFVVRASDEAAWVAERDGAVVGHVAVGTLSAAEAAPFTSALSTAGDDLRAVTTLFVGTSARGSGIGRQLLAMAEADILSRGLIPVLEVLPVHAAALALYESRGWRTIATDRPAWLPADAPDVRFLTLTPSAAASRHSAS